MLLDELPKSKHLRYLHAAYGAALASPGVGRNTNLRMGACLVRKKQILSVKNNSSRTHPKLLRFTPWPHLHAESAVILSHGLDNCAGATLYVLRILANKHLALARPCDTCAALISFVGIKRIIYTTVGGYYAMER